MSASVVGRGRGSGCVVLCMVSFATPVLGGADPVFTEAAFARGLFYLVGNVHEQFGAGHGLIDLDGDGDLDAVVLGATNGLVGVFENLGGGNFTSRSFTSGIAPIVGSGVSAADYDGDGDLDLYLSGWRSHGKLWRNNGGFHFTDVTAASGLTLSCPAMATAWSDVNADGWLDLYVCVRTGTNADPTQNKFYLNNGDGTFAELAVQLDIDAEIDPSLVPSFFDFDRDGDADLYLGTDKGTTGFWKNRLYRNDGGSFTEITAQANAEAYVDCMGFAIGDLNNDGFFDVYMTNLAVGNKLLMHTGAGAFVDQTAAAGLIGGLQGWGTVFADFNNDTRLDNYVCNTTGANFLFKGQPAFPFVEIGAAAGVATAAPTYCVSVGDVDGDGDLDMLTEVVGSGVQLFLNQTPNAGHWTRLRVIGQGANTHAIGAIVEVTDGGTTQLREIRSGVNYKSMNELTVHVGLDASDEADAVTVTWPGTGSTRTLVGVPADQVWTVYPPELMGDANGDGRVNRIDLLIMMSLLRDPQNATVVPGREALDMDADFDLDLDDVAYLVSKVGPIIQSSKPLP